MTTLNTTKESNNDRQDELFFMDIPAVKHVLSRDLKEVERELDYYHLYEPSETSEMRRLSDVVNLLCDIIYEDKFVDNTEKLKLALDGRYSKLY